MTVFNRYQNCYTEEKGKWRRNMDMSNAAIGGRIRQAREERSYTREKLAELADISADFLWEVEAGRKSMKVQNLGKIAAALCISTDYLIYGTSSYKENSKLNSMISAMPEDVQKQAEKLLFVFADTFRIPNQSQNNDDSSHED